MKRRDFIKNMSLATASTTVPNWLSRTVDKKKPTILVYGFNAFEDEINISQEIIKKLEKLEFKNANIKTTILGTSELYVDMDLAEAIATHKPDIIIGIGENNTQSPHVNDIEIETSSYYNGDRVFSDTNMNFDNAETLLKEKTLSVSQDIDPGEGACAQSLYHSINYFNCAQRPANTFFLHVKDDTLGRLEFEGIPLQGFEAFDTPTKKEHTNYDRLAENYTTSITNLIKNINQVVHFSPSESHQR